MTYSIKTKPPWLDDRKILEIAITTQWRGKWQEQTVSVIYTRSYVPE